jgi:hypothetical protein
MRSSAHLVAVTLATALAIRVAHAQSEQVDSGAPGTSVAERSGDQRPALSPATVRLTMPETLADVVPFPRDSSISNPSSQAYEADLRARLDILLLRELQLTSLQHPERRLRRIVMGGAAAGVGLVAFYGGSSLLYLGGEGPPSAHTKIVAYSVLGAAAAVSLAGLSVMIWGLTSRAYRGALQETGFAIRQTRDELERLSPTPTTGALQLSVRGVQLQVRF